VSSCADSVCILLYFIQWNINLETVTNLKIIILINQRNEMLEFNASVVYVFMLLVLLYGCETWSLTLREEHRLRVFEKRVLRRIFGPKRDEVTGGWRKLHNEEFRNLFPSPSKIWMIKPRKLRWVGRVAPMGETRNTFRILVGKPEVKRYLGWPRRRCVDNIKMGRNDI
jgi:hypothetical protein